MAEREESSESAQKPVEALLGLSQNKVDDGEDEKELEGRSLGKKTKRTRAPSTGRETRAQKRRRLERKDKEKPQTEDKQDDTPFDGSNDLETKFQKLSSALHHISGEVDSMKVALNSINDIQTAIESNISGYFSLLTSLNTFLVSNGETNNVHLQSAIKLLNEHAGRFGRRVNPGYQKKETTSAPSVTTTPTKRSGKKPLPSQAKEILKTWLYAHERYPYPNEDEKNQLTKQTGLTLTQVNNWFTNARRRFLKNRNFKKKTERKHKKEKSTPALSVYPSSPQNQMLHIPHMPQQPITIANQNVGIQFPSVIPQSQQGGYQIMQSQAQYHAPAFVPPILPIGQNNSPHQSEEISSPPSDAQMGISFQREMSREVNTNDLQTSGTDIATDREPVTFQLRHPPKRQAAMTESQSGMVSSPWGNHEPTMAPDGEGVDDGEEVDTRRKATNEE